MYINFIGIRNFIDASLLYDFMIYFYTICMILLREFVSLGVNQLQLQLSTADIAVNDNGYLCDKGGGNQLQIEVSTTFTNLDSLFFLE
jgi:hypothetical protein